ncbi:MAG: hypothetical protein JNL21_14655 [Myxococcales bacterium]|nr:hypothetical protein [Myxococcales bacterium]
MDPIRIHALRRFGRGRRDPFDRLLVAQAQEAGLTIVTCDDAFGAYGVPLVRA